MHIQYLNVFISCILFKSIKALFQSGLMRVTGIPVISTQYSKSLDLPKTQISGLTKVGSTSRIYFSRSLSVIRYFLQWWEISFPSALSAKMHAVDLRIRPTSMLWATGSHSVFGSRLPFSWSLLPSRYFTSLGALVLTSSSRRTGARLQLSCGNFLLLYWIMLSVVTNA